MVVPRFSCYYIYTFLMIYVRYHLCVWDASYLTHRSSWKPISELINTTQLYYTIMLSGFQSQRIAVACIDVIPTSATQGPPKPRLRGPPHSRAPSKFPPPFTGPLTTCMKVCVHQVGLSSHRQTVTISRQSRWTISAISEANKAPRATWSPTAIHTPHNASCVVRNNLREVSAVQSNCWSALNTACYLICLSWSLNKFGECM